MRSLRKRISAVGLVPTRQRLALGELLFGHGDRHVSPEGLYAETRHSGMRICRATVYNTLHAFVEHGLLREVPVEPNLSYFDTNLAHACHVYFEEARALVDVHLDPADMARLSRQLGGVDPERISVVIHVRGEPPRPRARRSSSRSPRRQPIRRAASLRPTPAAARPLRLRPG